MIPKWWPYLKREIRYAWRRLRNVCELCGKPRIEPNYSDIYSLGRYCRACNKNQNFARAYGMGARLLADMEYERRQVDAPDKK